MSKHIVPALLLAAALLLGCGATAQNSFGNNKTNNKGATTSGTSSGHGNSFGGTRPSSNSSSKGTPSTTRTTPNNYTPKANTPSAPRTTTTAPKGNNRPQSTQNAYSRPQSSTNANPTPKSTSTTGTRVQTPRPKSISPHSTYAYNYNTTYIHRQYGNSSSFAAPFCTTPIHLKRHNQKISYPSDADRFPCIYDYCMLYGESPLPTDIEMINQAINSDNGFTLLDYAFSNGKLYLLYKSKKTVYIAGLYHEGNDRMIKDKVNSDYSHLSADPATGGVWITKGDPAETTLGLTPMLFIYHNGAEYDEAAFYK